MKKFTILLAVLMVTSQLVGCGILRRCRDRLCRGAFCGAPALSAPSVVAPPTVVAPQPTIVVPQASVAPCPQVVCQPVCEPCCDPCCSGGGLSFPVGTPMMDAGCIGCDSSSGIVLPGDQVIPSPAN